MTNDTSTTLEHQDLTSRILKCFYDVYNELGYGFLESVYQNALVIMLTKSGLRTAQQSPLQVRFQGVVVGDFKADIVVEDKIILELKSAKSIDDSHVAQTLNYLKATGIHVGLLLNFGPKPEFKRLYFNQ